MLSRRTNLSRLSPWQAPRQNPAAKFRIRAGGADITFLDVCEFAKRTYFPSWYLPFALTVAFLFAGCAAVSPPKPPRIEKPQAVKDLYVIQVGFTLRISFTPPSLAMDGEGLTKPLEIEILRAVNPAGSTKMPSALPVSSTWITLAPADLAHHPEGQKLTEEKQLTPGEFRRSVGSTFILGVRSLTRAFRGRPVLSDPSNEAEVQILDVSGPVPNLQVLTTEHALDLAWAGPQTTLTGASIANFDTYRVYRSETGTAGSFRPIGETTDTHYRDRNFEFGTAYYYRVQAVFKQNGQVAESAGSAAVKIVPPDLFPPAAPVGLAAVYTSNAIELIWTANTEPDLSGYNVYRREAGENGRSEKLNKEILPTPLYRDGTVAVGHHYVYWVTAVDQARNESNPSATVNVESQ